MPYTKEQWHDIFSAYIEWINDNDYAEIKNYPADRLNEQLPCICNAALLSENTEAAENLVLNLASRKNEITPENWAVLNHTSERLKSLAEKGGWLPVQNTETEQDIEKHFPKAVYPQQIEKYLNSVTEVTQTAPEMPCAAALAAFALSLQGRCKIAYPSGNGHTEHMCLYMCIIADPSERKSSVFNLVIRRPFNRWRKEKKSEYEENISEYKAQRKILENQIASLQKKCNGANVPDQIESDIMRLQKKIDALQKPVSPHFLLDDTTPEALGKRMLETGESAGVFSAEGCFLSTLAGRYSEGSANIDLVLKAYSGEYTTVNRITREDVALERPLLSVCLALQPCLYDEFTNNKTLRERGLVARFIFCKPAPMSGNRKAAKKAKIDINSCSVYEHKLNKFLNMPQMPDEEIQAIEWESAAAGIMLDYLQDIEDTMKPEGMFSEEKAYAGKAGGVAVRIAGILHMIWTENAAAPISKETAYRAIMLHKYFFAEKVRDMQQAENKEHKQADSVQKRLYALTVQKCMASISVREAYMNMKNNFGLKNMKDFENVLDLLSNENIIEVAETGRKKRVIYISPYWNMLKNNPQYPHNAE